MPPCSPGRQAEGGGRLHTAAAHRMQCTLSRQVMNGRCNRDRAKQVAGKQSGAGGLALLAQGLDRDWIALSLTDKFVTATKDSQAVYRCIAQGGGKDVCLPPAQQRFWPISH